MEEEGGFERISWSELQLEEIGWQWSKYDTYVWNFKYIPPHLRKIPKHFSRVLTYRMYVYNHLHTCNEGEYGGKERMVGRGERKTEYKQTGLSYTQSIREIFYTPASQVGKEK